MMTLTQLARKTLEFYFIDQRFEPDKQTQNQFSKKLACFVTLTKQGNLRGCIGSLEAHQELWKDVQENAINAAFHDPRFEPLKEWELKDIKIEVSVLTKPKKLDYKYAEDLLNKISNNMGLILKKGFNSATFLPQVWKQIPDKKEFLEALSSKAGLDKDAWKTSEFLYYEVEKEGE